MKWARKIKEESWQMLSVESEEKKEVMCTPITVSLNFVDGIDYPKTMKILSSIGGAEIVVMIDSQFHFISYS